MRKRHISSTQIIPLSFFTAILAGTFFLMLPRSAAHGGWTPFADALFTSASAVCVTGLTVVDTYSYWSLFGQNVLLALIQIGGLGIISVISMIMLMAHRKFSLGGRLTLRDSLNLENSTGVLEFLRRIILWTFAAELLGACIFCVEFIPEFGLARGIRAAVFHSVSAFCNAGIDILGPDSLASYREDPLMLLCTMVLIIAGGLGYTVLSDMVHTVSVGVKKRYSPVRTVRRFSEHTKLVLCMTAILILAGAAVIFLAERSNPQTLGPMALPDKILNSLFESVSLRTAGFSTFPQKMITDVSCITAFLLMFIGGSPIGTAGGIKTTTFCLAVLNVTSYIRDKSKVCLFNRAVTGEQMKKASVIAEVSAAVVLGLTLMLIATNPVSIQDGFFEIISASSTVGLTRDVTGTLNDTGKLIVTVAMYLGRIGPITMAIFLTRRKRSESGVALAEGSFIIG